VGTQPSREFSLKPGGINLTGDLDMNDNDILDVDRIGGDDDETIQPVIDFQTGEGDLGIFSSGVHKTGWRNIR